MRKTNLIILISLTCFILSIVAICYSLISGLWGFNPTDIAWFNTKLFITSIFVFVITFFSTIIFAKIS
jgi:hypothetical protein